MSSKKSSVAQLPVKGELASSREEEREELLELNDRLEAYVSKTRDMRNAADNATERMTISQRSYEMQLGKMETSYRAQVESIKRQLDDEMNASVRLKDTISELEGDLTSANAIIKEVPALRREIGELEAHLSQAESKARAAEEKGNKLEASLKSERAAANDVTKKFKEAQTQLAVLAAEHKSARDEVALLREDRRKELETSKDRMVTKVNEARRDMENLHAQKLAELEGKLKAQYERDAASLRQRLEAISATNERLRNDAAKGSAQLGSEKEFSNGLLKKVTALEESHRQELEEWAEERRGLCDDIANERASSAKLQQEYQRVLGQNISLEGEIRHYARILAEEEVRAGLTPSPNSKKRRAGSDTGNDFGSSSFSSSSSTSTSGVLGSLGGLFGFGRGNTPSKSNNNNSSSTTTFSSSAVNMDGIGASLIGAGAGSTSVVDTDAEESDATSTRSGSSRNAKGGSSAKKNGKAAVTVPEEEPESIGKGIKKRGRGGKTSSSSSSSSSASTGEADEDDAWLDMEADKVEIVNSTGASLSLAGFKLVSEAENQTFVFPAGITLPPNGGVTVWSGPEAPQKIKRTTDLLWSRTYMWNNKGDAAVLYNPNGEVVAKITAERAARYDNHDLKVNVDLEAEVVMVTNISDAAIPLKGWLLKSDIGKQHFTFPDTVAPLAPGETLRIYSGKDAYAHADEPLSIVWARQNIWNNAGDSATLFDPKHRAVSRVAGRHHSELESAERRPSCSIM